MFLSQLNEAQRPAFLVLAKSLIAADGIFADEEMLMMEQYQQEMSLHIPFNDIQIEENQAIAAFADDVPLRKKQVFFELVALAYADQVYAKEENDLLIKIGNAFGLDAEFLEESKNISNELIRLYAKIGTLVSD